MEKETYRILLERALQAGKQFQGEHTQCIHYNATDSESSETIPVYENMLFVLALLKSRTAETIAEAKIVLERILYHQSRPPLTTEGNFPIYFHESPVCYSRWAGIKLFAPLYGIYKGFQVVLGEELRRKTSSALLALSDYALRAIEQHSADYGTTLQIGAGLFAVGQLLQRFELENQGKKILDDLLAQGPHRFWMSREGMGEMLIVLQMAYGKISESPWKDFWKHLERSWHPDLRTYRGPAFEEFQRGNSADPTVYDAYLALFSDQPQILAQNIGIRDLEAALIFDTRERIQAPSQLFFEGIVGSARWVTSSHSNYTWSAIEQAGLVPDHENFDHLNGVKAPGSNDRNQVNIGQYEPDCDRFDRGRFHASPNSQNFRGRVLDSRSQKGCHPFYLQWKNGDALCSLVCAGGRFSQMTYQRTPHGLDLLFTLAESIESDHPLENREVIFFCSANNSLKMCVDEHSATTFKFGELIEIKASQELLSETKVTLQFTLEQGKGNFLGHLMPGNRPAQLLTVKNRPQQAFDRQIFLRTLRKAEPCTVRVSIKLPL